MEDAAPHKSTRSILAYGRHAFVPRMQHLLCNVVPARLVLRGFDYFAADFHSGLAQALEHLLVFGRCYIKARVEVCLQRLTGRPGFAAFDRQRGRGPPPRGLPGSCPCCHDQMRAFSSRNLQMLISPFLAPPKQYKATQIAERRSADMRNKVHVRAAVVVHEAVDVPADIPQRQYPCWHA